MTSKLNLLNFGESALEALVLSWGEPRYRARQLVQWIHQRGVIDFEQMTNLSKSFRAKLVNETEVVVLETALERVSSDGTRKWLFRLDDGNAIETVFIPETGRGTLCVSSQVGCALNCSFCSTGKEGFNRNLTVGEIIGQLWKVVQALAVDDEHKVTNVVMMGMGEPLLNYEPVVEAMRLMLSDHAYGLSKYRVTLSTSGVIPGLNRLREDIPVALAVSLHAPNNTLRNELVPLNKKYPLEQLIPLCRDYYGRDKKRVVTFEYVMLDGVNDRPEDAKELIRLLSDVPCKVNLIPFNPFPKTRYQCSSEAAINAFQRQLMAADIPTWRRKTRGDDVDGACGQLAGNIKDRTGRNARWQRTGRLVQVSDRST